MEKAVLLLICQCRGSSTSEQNWEGGGGQADEEKENKANREGHRDKLKQAARAVVGQWQGRRTLRQEQNLPALPASIPLLLRIEPDSSDFDYLRSAFKFEVVSEQEDGVVIIASDDTDLNLFLEKVEGFVHKRHGTGVAAKVYDILDASQPDLRLDKLLSEPLRRKWHLIDDQTTYTVDVGVYCLGAVAPPDPPEREDGEDDEHFQQRMARWRVKYNQAQDEWGVLQTERAWQLESFVRGYEGSVLSITEEEGEPDVAFARLPDSFTVRIRIRDIGLKDLVMNHPHVFEVGEPDEMLLAPVGQARNDGQSLNSRMTARQPFA